MARRNIRLLRRIFTRDLVPVMVIDDDVIREEQAKNTNEILEIFVRVNDGGTRLSKSDLMFSLIKTKWVSAREHFDRLQDVTDRAGIAEIDKDFIIRGLLTISDVPTNFDVAVVEKNWPEMEAKFPIFETSLRCAIDFCRSQDVRILSSSLLDPVGTLLPVVYYLSHQRNGSVPDSERFNLRALIYFLLFNRFLSGGSRGTCSVPSRCSEEAKRGQPLSRRTARSDSTPAAKTRSCHNIRNARVESPLALNIAQPAVARSTLSWQERAEVDHIFPQSVYRPLFGNLVDDIGNLAYLGKLRNIRKSAEEPLSYFEDTPANELKEDFHIEDRSLLARDKFEKFVEAQRTRLVGEVRTFLGR